MGDLIALIVLRITTDRKSCQSVRIVGGILTTKTKGTLMMQLTSAFVIHRARCTITQRSACRMNTNCLVHNNTKKPEAAK